MPHHTAAHRALNEQRRREALARTAGKRVGSGRPQALEERSRPPTTAAGGPSLARRAINAQPPPPVAPVALGPAPQPEVAPVTPVALGPAPDLTARGVVGRARAAQPQGELNERVARDVRARGGVDVGRRVGGGADIAPAAASAPLAAAQAPEVTGQTTAPRDPHAEANEALLRGGDRDAALRVWLLERSARGSVANGIPVADPRRSQAIFQFDERIAAGENPQVVAADILGAFGQ